MDNGRFPATTNETPAWELTAVPNLTNIPPKALSLWAPSTRARWPSKAPPRPG